MPINKNMGLKEFFFVGATFSGMCEESKPKKRIKLAVDPPVEYPFNSKLIHRLEENAGDEVQRFDIKLYLPDGWFVIDDTPSPLGQLVVRAEKCNCLFLTPKCNVAD